jgi:hypothetical protein
MGVAMRARTALLIVFAIALLAIAVLFIRSSRNTVTSTQLSASTAKPANAPAGGSNSTSDSATTSIYAHNLMLRKGADFRFYVRWLRGQMTRAHRNVNPSFDDPDSFFIDIKTGVLRANIGDLTNFLNVSGMKDSPLKNIAMTGEGNQVKLKGILHKGISLPIELNGTLSAVSGNRIQVHVNKLSVLKIPFKALLGVLRVSVADLFHPKGVPGVQVVENDIFFDTQKLLPPPHIRGELTAVRIVNPDLEEVFGNAQGDVERVEEWRNFLRLRDGTIDFGKLTMHHVDLIMIDISKDAWFDLDLNNYQAQLVNGYTRMTPQAGLQIFMPDLREVSHTKANQDISIQWMKNRNLPPPADVTADRH